MLQDGSRYRIRCPESDETGRSRLTPVWKPAMDNRLFTVWCKIIRHLLAPLIRCIGDATFINSLQALNKLYSTM